MRTRAIALLVLGFASLVALGAFETLDEGHVTSAERAAVAVRQVAADNQLLASSLTAQQSALRTYVDSLANPDRTPRGLGERDDLLNDYLTASGEARIAIVHLRDDAQRAGIDATATSQAAQGWQSWAADRRAIAEADPARAIDPNLDAGGDTLFATFSGGDRIFADHLRAAEQAATARAADLTAAHARVFFSGLAIEAVALLLLGVALIWQVLQPVALLTHAAAELAAGRASPVPYQDRDDEVGSLARALISWQRASAEMFRVFQRSPIGIARLTANGMVLEANPSLEQMLGVEPHALEGRGLADLVAPEDQSTITAALRAVTKAAHDTTAVETRPLRADGTPFWADLTLAAVPTEDGSRYLLAMIEDVDVRKRQELELRHQAGHDALTDLPNRSLLEDRLEHAIAIARRRRSWLSVILLDLDRFKPVNDELGHHAGDEVLREVAHRLRSTLRESDTVARIGGDEFAIVLSGEDRTGARRIAAKVEDAMRPPIRIGGEARSVGVSAGIAVYPEDGSDALQLLAAADAAMYRHKRHHREAAARAAGY